MLYQVEIVTAFGEYRRTGNVSVVILYSDISLRLMPVRDPLHRVDCDELSDNALGKQLGQLLISVAVSQLVAYGYDPSCLLLYSQKLGKFLPRVADRFFEQDVISEPHRAHALSHVILVACRDDEQVRALLREKALLVMKKHIVRKPEKSLRLA